MRKALLLPDRHRNGHLRRLRVRCAAAAAIGNQQFFWWIFLIITFLLPYGLIVAELGTSTTAKAASTTGSERDSVTSGVPRISTDRVNHPFWIASLATMFPDILGMVFGVTFDLPVAIAIELGFVWIVYLMGRSSCR